VRYTARYKNHAKPQRSTTQRYTALRVGALDKALDTWYNTGVGVK